MTTEQPNLSAEQKADSGGGCGCGATDEKPEAPVTAEEPEPTTAASGNQPRKGCGSGKDHETEKAPVRAEEPVAASSGHAAGCAGMATRSIGDASRAMASCREMFERFMPAAAPAETNKTQATPTATGACKKEA